MGYLDDRIVILVIAATGLAGLIGWGGGLIAAEVPGLTRFALGAVLGLLFIGLLLGVWWGYGRAN